MTTSATTTPLDRDAWQRANLAALTAELAFVRACLADDEPAPPTPPPGLRTALDLLSDAFALSDFERAVLILCAGSEIDAGFPAALSRAHGNPLVDHPTFGLAMRTLPGAHWTAVGPAGPLRRWHLVTPGAGLLTAAPLALDEWVLHALVGAGTPDRRLAGLIEAIPPERHPAALRSNADAAGVLAACWERDDGAPTVLRGRSPQARRTAFVAACARVDWRPFALQAADLPATAAERDTLRRLWQREARYDPAALLIETGDDADPGTRRGVVRFTAGLGVPAVLAVDEHETTSGRATVVIDAAHPRPAEQRDLWRSALGASAGFASLNGALDRVVAHFDLAPETIVSAAGRARAVDADGPEPSVAEAGRRVWDACRHSARGGLDELAQRIDSSATFADLVLPAPQRALLDDVVAQVRQRGRVYDEWGMAGPAGAGLGITALFAGPSGTGKTLAAGVIANALSLDLYRVDLSQAVSKYIGETEKNLRRIFSAATESGAVLLFDEADALFGKRSEVRDSHDRYANMEVSYLLQAMEAYRGLAVLTTNQRSALDQAFLRRLRFVVTFPFPGPAERAEIWRRAFPDTAPTRELRIDQLAKLSVAGGNIRSIALHAAFSAAEAGTAIGMDDILGAAVVEYGKLDRQLSDAEIGGWR